MARIATWNIRWGGLAGPDRITEEIVRANPDLLVITEYQRGVSDALLARLHASGWTEQVNSAPVGRGGGVAIVSKTPFSESGKGMVAVPTGISSRVQAVRWRGLDMLGVYAPLGELAATFWPVLIAAVAPANSNTIILGDLNTGVSLVDSPKDNFFCSNHFVALKDSGFVDLFRAKNGDEAREYSWFSTANNGHRLDHVLSTADVVEAVRRCGYDHGPRERASSDHSMLLLELDDAALDEGGALAGRSTA